MASMNNADRSAEGPPSPVLVIGHRGMLGTDLMAHIRESLGASVGVSTIYGADLPEFDMTDRKDVKYLMRQIKPEIVFNAAGYTDVDGSEGDSKAAFAANAIGPENLAKAALRYGARFIHVSTDFIFDGEKAAPYTETDEPAPLSVYAKSKLKGENLVRKVGGDTLIVRAAWLYGRHGKNFVNTILRLADTKEGLRVVRDEIGSPTYTKDLAEALWRLGRGSYRGILNVVNAGGCSRYQLALKALEITRKTTPIVPIHRSEFKRAAAVPAYSVLSLEKLHTETPVRMRRWDKALCDYLTGDSPYGE